MVDTVLLEKSFLSVTVAVVVVIVEEVEISYIGGDCKCYVDEGKLALALVVVAFAEEG